jgi:hypothetical protein
VRQWEIIIAPSAGQHLNTRAITRRFISAPVAYNAFKAGTSPALWGAAQGLDTGCFDEF